MAKLDITSQGWTFPGTTAYDDGKLPALPDVTLTAYDFVKNDFTVAKLEHDFIFYEDIVIKQGATVLVKDTDYTAGDKDISMSEDITEILGTTKTVVNGVKITNPAYHSLTLTASGKYAGDAISAREYNNIYPVGFTYWQIPGEKSPAEMLMAGTWAELLEIDGDAISGEFFRLGGGNASAFESGVQNDAFQGHAVSTFNNLSAGSDIVNGNLAGRTGIANTAYFDGLVSDGTNGTPRTASETRSKNRTIKLWKKTEL